MDARDSLSTPAPRALPVVPALGPDPFGGDEDGGWLLDAYRVLIERRRTILTVLALSAVPLIAYVALVPEERVFEARAQLLVEPQGSAPLDIGHLTAVGDPEGSYYETQYRLLRSRTLARRTLVAMASEKGASPSPGAVDAFLRGLSVVHIQNSRLVEIRFKSEDPAYATRAVNLHTESYIRENVEFARGASSQTFSWLLRQLDDQRARVQSREAALHEYQRKHGPLDAQEALSAQRLSELNGAVLRAREQRAAKETAYQQVQEARRAGRSARDLAALLPTPMVHQLSVDLAALQRREVELSAQYGVRHPERVKVKETLEFAEARLEAEVARAIDNMSRQVAAARQEERAASGALASQTAQSSVVGRTAMDYDALKQDLANDRALLDKLQQRARELRLSSDYEAPAVRVIDPAELPRSPLPDLKWRNVMIGAVGAVVLSLLLAFGLHYLDDRVRSPEDIKAHLGLPCLGMVPRLAHRALDTGIVRRLVLPQAFREAIRNLRTQVLCTPAGQASRLVLVASAGGDEGKTLVATHLAAGLARIGHRVLLIDLDLRQPSVHKSFDAALQPGLSELLSGGATAGDSIRPTPVRDLWILPAGRALSNPGDLLGSSAFRRMMKSLPTSFDRIVLDSPPVMAFTDASLIAHEEAGIVFVVSADRTGRRAAQAALERLEAVGGRFVGAVLNRVDSTRIDKDSWFSDDENIDDDAYVEYAVPVPTGAASVAADGRAAGAMERGA